MIMTKTMTIFYEHAEHTDYANNEHTQCDKNDSISMLSIKMTSVSREGKVQAVFKLDLHVA